MGKTWTTKEQQEWLSKRIPEFHEAQKNNKVSRFHAAVQTAWFKVKENSQRKICFPDKDPEALLTKEESEILAKATEARKKQLAHWFEWNANPTRRAETRDATLFLKALGLDKNKIEKTAERAPQRVVVYQRLYGEKIAKAFEEEVAKTGAKSKAEKMKVRRALTQSMLEQEPQEVQDLIDADIKSWKEERDKALGEKPEDWVPTPEEYQSAVLALPNVMTLALNALSAATGWVIFAVAAGPHGQDKGNIWMQDFYVGPKNSAGHSFRDAHANFKEGFYTPFSEHVHNCFPPDVRAARIVKTKAKEGEEDQQVGTPDKDPGSNAEAVSSPEPVTSKAIASEKVSEANSQSSGAQDRPQADDTAMCDGHSVGSPVRDPGTQDHPKADDTRTDGLSDDDEEDALTGLVAQLQRRRETRVSSSHSGATAEKSILGTTDHQPEVTGSNLDNRAKTASPISTRTQASNVAERAKTASPRSGTANLGPNGRIPLHRPTTELPIPQSGVNSTPPTAEDACFAPQPETAPGLPAHVRLSTPAPGAPSEPIEFAYARANWKFPEPVSQEGTPANEVADINTPIPIDPSLLHIADIQAPGDVDYTISGAHMQNVVTPSTPDLTVDVMPEQTTTIDGIGTQTTPANTMPLQTTTIDNTGDQSLTAETGELLSAAEKRRRTREANKLKRKSENEQPAMEEPKRARRNIRPPTRPDATPPRRKPTEGEKKTKGQKN